MDIYIYSSVSFFLGFWLSFFIKWMEINKIKNLHREKIEKLENQIFKKKVNKINNYIKENGFLLKQTFTVYCIQKNDLKKCITAFSENMILQYDDYSNSIAIDDKIVIESRYTNPFTKQYQKEVTRVWKNDVLIFKA